MAKKIKISEAAKDLKITAKELAAFLEEKFGGKKTTSSSMTEEELNDMITSTKAYKLLSGARGLPKCDVDAIKDVIRRIVLITNENPEITELEINPVIAGREGQGCWAVDCLCVLKH